MTSLARFVVCAMVWAAASCVSHGTSSSGSARGGRDDGPKIVSASSGSKTAAGYDRAAKALEGTDTKAKRAKNLYLALHSADEARTAAKETLAMVDKLKASGEWVAGLHYQVYGDRTLDEKQILAGLAEMLDSAQTARDDLEKKLATAYRSEYPTASKDQLAALDELGPPTTIEEAAAPKEGKPKKGKPKKGKKPAMLTCWKWDTDELAARTCWKADGTVASHDQKKKEPPAEADVAAEAPASSGESSSSTPAASEPDKPADTGPTCKPVGAEVSGSNECCSHKMRCKTKETCNWVCCEEGEGCT